MIKKITSLKLFHSNFGRYQRGSVCQIILQDDLAVCIALRFRFKTEHQYFIFPHILYTCPLPIKLIFKTTLTFECGLKIKTFLYCALGFSFHYEFWVIKCSFWELQLEKGLFLYLLLSWSLLWHFGT